MNVFWASESFQGFVALRSSQSKNHSRAKVFDPWLKAADVQTADLSVATYDKLLNAFCGLSRSNSNL
jgi:hypothetical protein